MDIKINTILSSNEFRLKEKGSVFDAYSFPSQNEIEAMEHLNSLKKKFYDATHHCYAYKFNSEKLRYSDDGEPNGTAGLRILNAINHFELTYLIVIVVRYFGGTKLGVGPLGKAYYESALGCLENSEKITKELYKRLTVTFPFELTNLTHNLLSKHSAKIEETFYSDEQPQIRAVMPFNHANIFFEEILSQSNGIVKTVFTDDKLYF